MMVTLQFQVQFFAPIVSQDVQNLLKQHAHNRSISTNVILQCKKKAKKKR